MEMEQLKLIMETLTTMGEAGKDAFIWWLVLDKLIPVIAWLLVFSGFLLLVFYITRVLSVFERFKELRDVLDIGSPGAMTTYEAEHTIRKALSLARDHNK